MDECTYRSITGLTNYYGFKSLLKNSNIGSRYSCSDETIVFNRTISIELSGGAVSLNNNQVAVILNVVAFSKYNTVLTFIETSNFDTFDVNGTQMYGTPNNAVVGQLVTDTIEVQPMLSDILPITLTIAIFDLL